MVSGQSGIGKSSLVHQLYKPLTQSRGYYIEGKFDQFQSNIPYSALIQAFNNLVDQILTEDEDKLLYWRKTIMKAVGALGRVLTEVVPAMEHIIGEQPEIPFLEGTEAQNRFNYVLQSFMDALSQKDHPLIIFVDDLQWADVATLNLIRNFMSNQANPALKERATVAERITTKILGFVETFINGITG